MCIRVEQILQTIRKNICTNKLYELSKYICICVEQILQTTREIFVRTEQIIWTVGTNMYTCQNKLYQLVKQKILRVHI
jgi:hypothetical protein